MIILLVIAHYVADWRCQTNWMAINKSKRWDALMMHVTVYMTVMAAAIVAYRWWTGVPSPSNKNGPYWFFYGNYAAHFIQDAITSRLTSRWFFFAEIRPSGGVQFNQPLWRFLPENRSKFFNTIGIDQMLHYIVLFKTAEWWLQ